MDQVVGLPDRRIRESILRCRAQRLVLADDVDLPLIARMTTGFDDADLAKLCDEAERVAVHRSQTEVSLADFSEALDQVLLDGAKVLLPDTQERRVVAYRQAGRALVSWFTAGVEPLQKVTILVGQEELDPVTDRGREHLHARLRMLLGGWAAEQLLLGEADAWSGDDLARANRLAHWIVTGCDPDGLQPPARQAQDPGRNSGEDSGSEWPGAQLTDAVRRLIDDCHQASRQLLTRRRDLLDRLAQALLQDECVTQNSLRQWLAHTSDRPPTGSVNA